MKKATEFSKLRKLLNRNIIMSRKRRRENHSKVKRIQRKLRAKRMTLMLLYANILAMRQTVNVQFQRSILNRKSIELPQR